MDPINLQKEARKQQTLQQEQQQQRQQRDQRIEQQIIQSRASTKPVSARRNGIKKLFGKDTPKPINDVTDTVKGKHVDLQHSADEMQFQQQLDEDFEASRRTLYPSYKAALRLIMRHTDNQAGEDKVTIGDILEKLNQAQQEAQGDEQVIERLQVYRTRYLRLAEGGLPPLEDKNDDAQPVATVNATQFDLGISKSVERLTKRGAARLVQEPEKYKAAPLFDHEPSIEDVQQGMMGDCYFLAALSSVIQQDPKQIMDNIHDNGDNTVTVRFFRERSLDDIQKDDEYRDNLELEEKDYNTLAPAAKMQRLLGIVQLQRLAPDKPVSFENLQEAGILDEVLKDVRKNVKEGFDRKQRDSMKDEKKTPKEIDAYFASPAYQEDLDAAVKTAERKAGGALESQIQVLGALLNGIKAGMTQRKVDGKTFMDYILDEEVEHSKEHVVLSQLRTILKDPSKEMKDALPLLASYDFTVAFSSLLVDSFGKMYEQEHNESFVSAEPEKQKRVRQEVRVTITKDLPEVQMKNGAVTAAYAKGPLWLKLMEKAYASSGLNGQDSRPDIAQLEKSYRTMEGGNCNTAFTHLTGKTARWTHVFSSSNAEDSEVSVIGGLNHFLQSEGQKADTLHEKLRGKYADAFAKRSQAAQELQALLMAHEKSKVITEHKGSKSKGGGYEIKYRRGASGIDDIVRVIVESRLNLVGGKADSEENQQARRELADRIAGDLKVSTAHSLQFARFSGEYTQKAVDTFNQIQEDLNAGRTVATGTERFIPDSVESSGLNREAIDGGIVEGHAYSILGTKMVKNNRFLVLRNPWKSGETIYSQQANGGVTSGLRRNAPQSDGVFLVELNDFMRKFSRLYHQTE